MAAPLLNENEERFLRHLLRRKVRFMMVGLSAAALQGAPVVTQDVDLWFAKLPYPELEAAARELRVAYVPPSIQNPPMFAGGGVELFDIVLRLDGLGSFEEEIKHCIELPLGRYRLKILRMDRILQSKLAANRPKDQLVIPVLADSLATQNSLHRQKVPRLRALRVRKTPSDDTEKE